MTRVGAKNTKNHPPPIWWGKIMVHKEGRGSVKNRTPRGLSLSHTFLGKKSNRPPRNFGGV